MDALWAPITSLVTSVHAILPKPLRVSVRVTGVALAGVAGTGLALAVLLLRDRAAGHGLPCRCVR